MSWIQAARDTITQGGGSFVPASGSPARLRARFVVGGRVATVKVPRDVAPSTLASVLAGFAGDAGSEVVGTWVDGSTVYVDACDTFQSRTTALKVARRRGELAIWDSVLGCALETGVRHAAEDQVL